MSDGNDPTPSLAFDGSLAEAQVGEFARFPLPDDQVTGVLDRLGLPAGASLWAFRGRYRHAEGVHMRDEMPYQSLNLTLPVDGHIEVQVPGMQRTERIPAGCAALHVAVDRWITYRPTADTDVRLVTLEVPLSAMAALADSVRMAPEIRRRIDPRTADGGLVLLPLDRVLRDVAELALPDELGTPAGAWLAHARALDATLHALQLAGTTSPETAHGLGDGERARLVPGGRAARGSARRSTEPGPDRGRGGSLGRPAPGGFPGAAR